jgi:hypothetical protein
MPSSAICAFSVMLFPTPFIQKGGGDMTVLHTSPKGYFLAATMVSLAHISTRCTGITSVQQPRPLRW